MSTSGTACRRCHRVAKLDSPCRWCGDVGHLVGFRLGPHSFGYDEVRDDDGTLRHVRWECGSCDRPGRWVKPAKKARQLTWYQKSKVWWTWLAHVRRDPHIHPDTDAYAKRLAQAS